MISLIIWDSGPNPQLVVGILCGGLGGSVFTWYINRPKPQIVTYNVTTISLGADPTTKNLVPNLKIQVGGENVPVMHTHTIEFNVPRESYVDSADVATVLLRVRRCCNACFNHKRLLSDFPPAEEA